MPSAFGPRASMLRRNPSAARSSAASHEHGCNEPFTRMRGVVRRGYERPLPSPMLVVYRAAASRREPHLPDAAREALDGFVDRSRQDAGEADAQLGVAGG